MRSFDTVILTNKLNEYIVESRKNINSKIETITLFLQQMKEENEQAIFNSKLIRKNYIFFSN